jgi:hypothetical protein
VTDRLCPEVASCETGASESKTFRSVSSSRTQPLPTLIGAPMIALTPTGIFEFVDGKILMLTVTPCYYLVPSTPSKLQRAPGGPATTQSGNFHASVENRLKSGLGARTAH